MEETCGMKLVELQIGDAASSTPGCGDAIAARAVGIGRVTVRFARASGRENDSVRVKCLDRAAIGAQQVGTASALLCQDQVDQAAVHEQINVIGFGDPTREALGNSPPCLIRSVDHSTVAVTTFRGEVEFSKFCIGLIVSEIKADAL